MKRIFIVVAGLLLAASTANAQKTPLKSSAGAPCCAIVAIDAATATVTAKDNTGKTFQFTVSDAALLRSLRVGQSVFADFMKANVSLKYGEPCCNIIKAAVKPQEPCCNITAVDAATGIATAKEIATGRVFRFEVKDKTLLTSLKVGQAVFADFGSSKVRIHGAEPCCNIIGHGIN
jgi:Cu/Ag efflux protein CusF